MFNFIEIDGSTIRKEYKEFKVGVSALYTTVFTPVKIKNISLRKGQLLPINILPWVFDDELIIETTRFNQVGFGVWLKLWKIFPFSPYEIHYRVLEQEYWIGGRITISKPIESSYYLLIGAYIGHEGVEHGADFELVIYTIKKPKEEPKPPTDEKKEELEPHTSLIDISSELANIKRDILNKLDNMLSSITNSLNTLTNAIVNAVISVMNSVVSTLSTIFSSIIDAITKAFSSVVSLINDVISNILRTMNTLISKILTAIENVVNTVIEYITQLLDKINELLIQPMIAFFTELIDILKNIPTALADAFSSIIFEETEQ